MESPQRIWTNNISSVLGLIIAAKSYIFLVGFFGQVCRSPALISSISLLIRNSWYRWDAAHYWFLANYGYPSAGNLKVNVFYPFYPTVIRLFSLVIRDSAWSGLLVSNLASVFGFFIFYRLACEELESEEQARAALIALLFFPTAYFFNAPYAEGLYLLLAVSAFLAARKSNWALAGAWGMMAAMTRVTGILLFPALLMEFILQRREQRGKWTDLFFLFFIPCGLAIYLLINSKVLGSPFAFTNIYRERFHRQLDYPWMAVLKLFVAPFNPGDVHWWLKVPAELIADFILIVGTVLTATRLRLSYTVYMICFTLLTMSTSLLQSMPRYLLTAFPLFFVIGKRDRFGIPWRMSFCFSVGLLTILTLRFTAGFWAF